MRIDRMLAITVLLLNRGRVSAKELSERFEVSIRTIYRDIDAINLAGIPVISYPGNNGGFGIMENYKLDRQVLSMNDMVSILSALKGISSAVDSRHLDNAIEKIESIFPDEARETSAGIDEQLVVDIFPWGYRQRQKKHLETILLAIRENSLLRMTYRNAEGSSSTRNIEPMTLVLKGYAWYLFAYCHLKQDFRVFRLSRISDISEAGEIFARRPASYKDYFQYDEAPADMTNLVLKFLPAARARVEDYFDTDLIENNPDGTLLVRVSFPEDEWVYSSLLSYGELLEVLEPPHIRRILREKAQKISELYQP